MIHEKKKITVVGCGAYGLALATILKQKNQVTVYTKFETEKEEVEQFHQRKLVLPNVVLPKLKITCKIEEAVKEADILIFAVPFSVLEETFSEIMPFLQKECLLVIASKGLEVKSGKTAYEILKEKTSLPILVLSGPTFAKDIAVFEPAVLTLATLEKENYQILKNCFPETIFLEYTKDLFGVSYCGAMKNVFAILYGYLEGKNATTTTKAAVLYRSLMALHTVLQKLGCASTSLLKASGIADFYMTAESSESRNHTLGVFLATKSKEEINTYLKETTVEGVTTLNACLSLLEKKKIEAPIFMLLKNILNGQDYEIQTILEVLSE